MADAIAAAKAAAEALKAQQEEAAAAEAQEAEDTAKVEEDTATPQTQADIKSIQDPKARASAMAKLLGTRCSMFTVILLLICAQSLLSRYGCHVCASTRGWRQAPRRYSS